MAAGGRGLHFDLAARGVGCKNRAARIEDGTDRRYGMELRLWLDVSEDIGTKRTMTRTMTTANDGDAGRGDEKESGGAVD